MSEVEERPHQSKRKRKKSFITLAKKGKIDRGSSIAQEDYDYFLNILKEISSASDDDIGLLANNVLGQIEGKEHFMKNQLASRVIDNILPYASPEIFENICKSIAGDFRQYIDDVYASFIVQTLLKTCLHRNLKQFEHPADIEVRPNTAKTFVFNVREEFSDEHVAFCSEHLMKTSKFLLNNLEDYVADSYANFVIRTCLTCLVGLDSITPKPQSPNTAVPAHQEITGLVKICETPAAWLEIFTDYTERLPMWPTFSEFPYEPKTSGLLQVIVKCLQAAGGKKEIAKLCKGFFIKAEEEMHGMFNCQPSLHFLEVVLSVAGPKLVISIHKHLFAGHLKALACDSTTNFAVQRLLEHCQDKAVFEACFDELIDHLEEVLCSGSTGVVVELAKGCNRLTTKQGAFVLALQKALHCTGEHSHKLLQPLLKLTPLDVLEKEAEKRANYIHPHGSIVLQQMLYFNKPIKLVQNLMELKKEDLVHMLSDKKGSFVADAFCASKFVGEKSRDKLIKHLTDNFLDLALSQFGSRTLETLYNVGNAGHKALIVGELSKKLNQLNSTKFGRIINAKFCCFAFGRGEQAWNAALNSAGKAETLFKDLVPMK